MKTVRKLLAGLLLAVACLTTAADSAQAGNGGVINGGTGTVQNYRIYYVMYRSCACDSWHYYAGYYNSNDAAYVANYVRYYGYEAFVY